MQFRQRQERTRLPVVVWLQDFDSPHCLAISYIYELPFGRNRKVVNSGAPSYIVGGFKTSGVYTFASGRPFTVSSGGSIASTLDAFGALATTPQPYWKADDRWEPGLLVLRCQEQFLRGAAAHLTDAYQLQNQASSAMSAAMRFAAHTPASWTLL